MHFCQRHITLMIGALAIAGWLGISGLLPVHAETAIENRFSIRAKSFIAKIDGTDSSQFDVADPGHVQKLVGFLVNTGVFGGEDPKDGLASSEKFRLHSTFPASVTCAGNKIVKWNLGGLQVEAGKEFGFIAAGADISKSLSVKPSAMGAVETDRITFSYAMRGQPNEAGNVLMRQVRSRTCTFIWHEVEGTLACRNGKVETNVSLKGSGFPSHRLWVDNALVKDLPQGPFKRLWKCDSLNPVMVE
jgi:hypothetical protein